MSTSRVIPLMRIISVLLIIASITLFVLGALFGGVEFYIFLIIPVIKLNGILGILGFIALISGILFFFISKIKEGRSKQQSDAISEGIEREMATEWGGIIFIGPFPIIIGSDRARKNFPKWRYLLLIGIGIVVITYILAIAMLALMISP